MRPKTVSFRGASVFALASMVAAGAANAESTAPSDATLSFGIVPQQSATRLAQVWVPFLDHLGAQTGLTFRFTTAKDIPAFEACLAKGAYDVAYMNPYHYTTFHDASGYRAIARQRDKRLKGLIVVRKGDTAARLSDLNGRKVAFPSPAAFGASVIPRAEMRASNIDITPVYVKSHDSVYRAVSAGLLPAGGGVQRTFNNIPADLRATLKVIYRTDGYTPHAFAAHPRVKRNVSERIVKALEEFESSAPKVLKPLGMKGFRRAANADWNDVRALNLKRAQTEVVVDGANACHSG